MWEAIGQLLPIAIAAAVSSIPITATILILVSDRRDEAALPYVLGLVLGATVFLTLATIAAQALPDGRGRQQDTVVGVLEIVIGVALVLSGLAALLRQRSAGERHLPGWMSRLDTLRAGPAFGLGLALNVRPKALLLVAAAGLVLRRASLRLEGTALAMAVFTVVATSTVVAPVVLTLLSPDRMSPRLVRARTWLGAYGPVVTALVVVLVGAIVLGTGIAHL
jgi:Sap, sulfolipid-1-addressing protein